MKRRMKTLQVAILMISIITAFTLVQCDKIADDTAKPMQQDASSNQVVERITKFIDKIEGKQMKSSEEYSREESEWLLEASANYLYVRPEADCDEIYKGEALLSVALSNDKVNGQQIAALYSQIVDTLSGFVSHLNLNEPALQMLDMKWVDSNGQSSLKMTFIFGSGGGGPINLPGNFGSSDWWWYGMGMGKCNGQVCCTGKDAATQIMQLVRWNMPYPMYHSFFTDIDGILLSNPIDLPPNHPDPNYCYFPTFYNTSQPPYDSSFHLCLSPLEMNYYYNQLISMINPFKPYIDPNNPSLGKKSFAGTIIIPVTTQNSNGYEVVEHMTILLYGKSNGSITLPAYDW